MSETYTHHVDAVNMISVYTFCDNRPMDTMGKRLKWAREQAGFKQSASAAAKKHGWPISTYLAHENGQNDFDTEIAEKYAAAFNVNSGWLLTGKGDHRLMDNLQTNQRLDHLTRLVEQLMNTVQQLAADSHHRGQTPSPPSGKSKRIT